VAAVNADSALFSSDFRAPERLFSLLMQAAGRAGRDAVHAAASEMWVQTWNPEHPLFAALKKHDFPAFAEQQLKERQQAAMPPFAYQALLRADARTQEVAQEFLKAAAAGAEGLEGSDHVIVYAPVPMQVQRVANVERAQLLLESASRPALQAFLAAWQPVLHGLRMRGLIRWAVDVDPLVI
jgi:primosomal protein N' (replication factor Y)